MKRRTPLDVWPPSPDPARSDSKEIVNAIVEAARELPPEASIKTISERAGVGVASIYRYFPNKDALLAEIGRRIHHDVYVAASEALDETDTLEEAIAACVRIGMELPFGNPDTIERVHAILPFAWHREASREISQRLIEAVTEALGRYVVATPHQLTVRTRVMIQLLRGMARTRVLMPEYATTVEEEAPILEAALLACATNGLQRREH